jgi:hypothetical protein
MRGGRTVAGLPRARRLLLSFILVEEPLPRRDKSRVCEQVGHIHPVRAASVSERVAGALDSLHTPATC